jgi:hypothetical protein
MLLLKNHKRAEHTISHFCEVIWRVGVITKNGLQIAEINKVPPVIIRFNDCKLAQVTLLLLMSESKRDLCDDNWKGKARIN